MYHRGFGGLDGEFFPEFRFGFEKFHFLFRRFWFSNHGDWVIRRDFHEGIPSIHGHFGGLLPQGVLTVVYSFFSPESAGAAHCLLL